MQIASVSFLGRTRRITIMQKRSVFLLFMGLVLSSQMMAQRHSAIDSLVRDIVLDSSSFVFSTKVKSVPRLIRKDMRRSNFNVKLGNRNSRLTWRKCGYRLNDIFKKENRIVQCMRNERFCIVFFERGSSMGNILYSFVYRLVDKRKIIDVKVLTVNLVPSARKDYSPRQLFQVFLVMIKDDKYNFDYSW